MRLISLAANKETFRAVNFNKTGASFILAKQDNPENSDKSKTYNGVGKSLLASLIDFCLGAGTNSKITKSLQSALPEWHFILKFEIDSRPYTVIRQANTPKYINLNEENLKLKYFHSKLQKLCFEIPEETEYLSFRSLLPFFIRPSRQSYINYDEPTKSGKAYQKQLYNAALLGLDISFSQKKMHLKQEIDKTKEQRRNIKDDPILKQFFEGDRDSSLALAELNEKIEILESNLQKFEVAENYYQIKQEADTIKNNLDEIQNKIQLRNINLESIDKSLEINPDISRSDIQNIYDESNLVFKSDIAKQLTDLETFYKDLIINRTKRLQNQKNEIISQP